MLIILYKEGTLRPILDICCTYLIAKHLQLLNIYDHLKIYYIYDVIEKVQKTRLYFCTQRLVMDIFEDH